MEKPKPEDYIEPEEMPEGTILGYLNEEDYIKALEKYIDYLKSNQITECEHPYAYVMSKCNGEINKCLKCGKNLNEVF